MPTSSSVKVWYVRIAILTLLIPLLVSASQDAAETCTIKALPDCVDTNIGGIGQLLTATVPYVQVPHGMARIALYVDPSTTDRYTPPPHQNRDSPYEAVRRNAGKAAMLPWRRGPRTPIDDVYVSKGYVSSAMGFHPVCPGRPKYDIGKPLFKGTTIDLGNGDQFVIEAEGTSPQNKYIQSASLNGQRLDRAWFRQWGTGIAEAPPSALSYE